MVPKHQEATPVLLLRASTPGPERMHVTHFALHVRVDF